MSKITVVGSFVTDMVASIEDFPNEGQSIIGTDFNKYLGGKGANQAVTIARLGGDVTMIGKVGNDDNGRDFLELFTYEKIDTKHILTSDNKPTALGLIQINNKGENKIVVVPGANYDYTIDELMEAEDIIKASDIVLTQLELNYDVTFELIKLCHRHNIKLILNPAPAIKIDNDILKLVNTITPNETELAVLTGINTTTMDGIIEAAKYLLDLGVENVVATLGSKGALIANKNTIEVLEGFKVKAIDTVAAGDSFNGALAKCLSDGCTYIEAIKFANAVGALTVQKKGAIPSLPRLNEVNEFINSQNNN